MNSFNGLIKGTAIAALALLMVSLPLTALHAFGLQEALNAANKMAEGKSANEAAKETAMESLQGVVGEKMAATGAQFTQNDVIMLATQAYQMFKAGELDLTDKVQMGLVVTNLVQKWQASQEKK